MNGIQQPEDKASQSLAQQAYRESWKLYQRSLEAPQGVWPGWDWIVLTASDERQAKAFELQIDWRRKAGLLPRATRFAVVADPGGSRVGSGGATVNVLAELARRHGRVGSRRDNGPASLFAGKRVLVIHSGGESRRLPHCSALGKVFARVPHELPDGRPSTLFDEFLISLSGLPYRMHEGVIVASGDVLLLFDHSQLDLSRQGIVGVAARTQAGVGTRHGVYVPEPAGDGVRQFLHKQTLAALRSAGAIDPFGDVLIDTGIVWFDPPSVAKLLAVFGFNEQMEFAKDSPFAEIAAASAPLNLYGDLLMPLAQETGREQYLEDASDGLPAAALKRLRPRIWEQLRGIPFRVQSLSPVEFIHFGTTAEYVSVMTEGIARRSSLGWNRMVASHFGGTDPVEEAVVLNSSLGAIRTNGRKRVVVVDCCLGGELAVGDRCVLSHVWTDHALDIKPGVALHQLPVTFPGGGPANGFVTCIYGVQDNPKIRFGQAGATYLNRPWVDWLKEANVAAEEIWEDTEREERSLWNARLFPVAETREESLRLALWLQSPTDADADIRRLWRTAARLSLGESARRADVVGILEDLRHLDDRVRVERFCEAVERERWSRETAVLLGDRASDVRRRAALAARRFRDSAPPVVHIRAFKAIADALSEHKGDKRCIVAAQRYEDHAFKVLARLIRQAVPRRRKTTKPKGLRKNGRGMTIVRAPARIDFAGGWSDTPPFSLEYGGKVLNAAIQRGESHPILVRCERLGRPVLILESIDLGVCRTFERPDAVLQYSDPSDPLALHKASLVLLGLVKRRRGMTESEFAKSMENTLGGGLRLTTEVQLPHGSGLGTSSILAGALLACLSTHIGRPVEFQSIYDEVLCLEQMLTTGGGWQDQVGGMLGGIKLTTTEPGLPQRLQVQPVRLSPDAADELDRRLVLVYSGQRRLAKDILRSIMGQFMSRNPDVVKILCDIRDLAEAQRNALENGQLDEFGRLMADHWEMNKRLDPGTSNPFIDNLFEVCRPYVSGAKLAGAGGGGFMIAIAHDDQARKQLEPALADAFPGTNVGLWPCRIAHESLLVES